MSIFKRKVAPVKQWDARASQERDEEGFPLRFDGFPITYRSDFLWTIHNSGFQNDPKFQRAYAREVQTHDFDYGKMWRTHIVIWAVQNGLRRSGDFVECGCNKGGVSAAAMTYVDWNAVRGERRFFLMDTFNGLRPELMSEEEKRLQKSPYLECFAEAQANLKEFDGAILIRGAIPETLPQNPAREVAYLHIDMNCAAPEVEALRYFWPKLVTGALVVLDDYAFRGFQPQKDAMDTLGEELGFTIASLPTGQGLITK